MDGVPSYSNIQIVTYEHKELVRLFPNPSTDYIHIKGEETGMNQSVQILDQQGGIVITTTAKDKKIDIRSLPKGIYFLQMEGINNFTPIRFIKF